MAAPLTPAEMHAFTEFLGMLPMLVIGFIVLVVVLIKTAPRGRRNESADELRDNSGYYVNSNGHDHWVE
jgi:hypothetical protein